MKWWGNLQQLFRFVGLMILGVSSNQDLDGGSTLT